MEAATREAELEQARAKLEQIEHIVVLQLENRSFDHMLGYLAMPEQAIVPHPGSDLGTDVNGLDLDTMLIHYGGGDPYRLEPLDESAFDSNKLDPPHDAKHVATQLAGGDMTGFVEAWADKLRGSLPKRVLSKLLGWPGPSRDKLQVVMSYLMPDQVPVFDHLARRYCVCDSWFCSVPGPTMPNRFFSVAGETKGVMDNVRLLALMNGRFTSLFQYLRDQSMWRWYSSDPGILRTVDKRYRFDVDPEYDHFAYFDGYTEVQKRTFLSDVRDGTLPQVAWIDPNFAIGEMFPLGNLLDTPGSNDDHPPSPVRCGQKLVNTVYEAIGRSERYRDNTLLVIYYDEHGGFFDHQMPPTGWGPRIPALLVGARVKQGVCKETFDHASVIKTVLLKFGDDRWLTDMPDRVRNATDLSVALRDDGAAVEFEPVPNPGDAAVGPGDLEPRPLGDHASKLNYAVDFLDRHLTDLQRLIVQYHAIPLRTGFQSIRFLRFKSAVKVVRQIVRPLTERRQQRTLAMYGERPPRRGARALPPRRP